MALAAATVLAGCSEAPRCRGEVVAAFERLRTSGRPYRKEMTITVGAHQTFHQTAAYLPPDRLHEVTNNRTSEVESNGVRFPARETTSELIRVGARAWSIESNERIGWREWQPGLAQEIYSAGMDFWILPDRVVPANAAFECLGPVEFEGTVYTGYRALLSKVVLTFSSLEGSSDKDREEMESKLRQMPWLWHSVFVDSQSGLPVYDLVAEENQPDKPQYRIHFIYPTDIKVEPPVQ